MFERFTDRARRVVVLAQEEARMLNHNYIGTEHILLGLIHEGEGVAAQALEAMGISLDDVRVQVEQIIGQGEAAPSGHIPFTPRAKKVLELSLREALQLGHNYIGTEHVLLGILREGEGVAAQVLVKLGADLARVRQQVISLLPGYGGDPGPGGGPFRRARAALRRNPMAGQMVVEDSSDVGLEQLDDAALTAIVAARGEVRRVATEQLEPEHLVAGIMAQAEDPAAQMLQGVGVTIDGLRSELAAIAEPCDDPAAIPRLATGTWGALLAADTAGRPIGTLSLLAALVATSSSVRAVLRAAGGDLDALRQRLAGTKDAA